MVDRIEAIAIAGPPAAAPAPAMPAAAPTIASMPAPSSVPAAMPATVPTAMPPDGLNVCAGHGLFQRGRGEREGGRGDARGRDHRRAGDSGDRTAGQNA